MSTRLELNIKQIEREIGDMLKMTVSIKQKMETNIKYYEYISKLIEKAIEEYRILKQPKTFDELISQAQTLTTEIAQNIEGYSLIDIKIDDSLEKFKNAVTLKELT